MRAMGSHRVRSIRNMRSSPLLAPRHHQRKRGAEHVQFGHRSFSLLRPPLCGAIRLVKRAITPDLPAWTAHLRARYLT